MRTVKSATRLMWILTVLVIGAGVAVDAKGDDKEDKKGRKDKDPCSDSWQTPMWSMRAARRMARSAR
jgi:hypothetical protein